MANRPTNHARACGYCRVSTTAQDHDRQRLVLHEYANGHDLRLDTIIEFKASTRRQRGERGIDALAQYVADSGIRNIIVAELSRFGGSVGEILRLVDEFVQEKQCRLIFVKEHLVLDATLPPDIGSQVTLTMFALLAQVERYLIRERTRDALAALKASGVKLGRPAGKSKLDAHERQIRDWLDLGVTQRAIAAKLGCSNTRWAGGSSGGQSVGVGMKKLRRQTDKPVTVPARFWAEADQRCAIVREIQRRYAELREDTLPVRRVQSAPTALCSPPVVCRLIAAAPLANRETRSHVVRPDDRTADRAVARRG
jgi:DNA invertase Pin-like site-specific DNA recombinase